MFQTGGEEKEKLAIELYDKNPYHNYQNFDFSLLGRKDIKTIQEYDKKCPEKAHSAPEEKKQYYDDLSGPVEGYFVVNVVHARNLPIGDAKSSDPFVLLEFPDKKTR